MAMTSIGISGASGRFTGPSERLSAIGQAMAAPLGGLTICCSTRVFDMM